MRMVMMAMTARISTRVNPGSPREREWGVAFKVGWFMEPELGLMITLR
jgi:hypothetical protein